jgi:hypothetical protein
MPRELRPATAAEAVEGFKAVEELEGTEEALVVSDLSQGFGGPEVWGSVAYPSMCERTGSAGRLRLLAADAVLDSNGSIGILGQGDYGGPPGMEIAAEFEVPSAGTYACTSRLSRQPTWPGSPRFAIDQTILGTLSISAPPTNYTYVVRLGPGNHTLRIEAILVSFWFHSLTVFRIPELAPP